MFPRSVTLKSEAPYFIVVSTEDVPERYGEGLKKKVICEDVEFEFLEDIKEEEIDKGQIPELLFQPLQDTAIQLWKQRFELSSYLSPRQTSQEIKV